MITPDIRTPDEQYVSFLSSDGVPVLGTYQNANNAVGACLLVHGVTEDRDEAFGFYKKLAAQLASSGFSSLRFDLRGHGKSQVKYRDISIFNSLSDIDEAVKFLLQQSGVKKTHLLGTSFGGGLAALYAAQWNSLLSSLVLLCPNLDYRTNWIERKAYWTSGKLTSEGIRALNQDGALVHNEFRIGRCLFHELLHVRPFEHMHNITVPCLTVHGTADSIVSDDLSVIYYKCNQHSELLRIDGADHGFVEPEDDDFTSPITIQNLDRVFAAVTDWLRRHNELGTD